MRLDGNVRLASINDIAVLIELLFDPLPVPWP